MYSGPDSSRADHVIDRSHVEDVRKNVVPGQSRLSKCEISAHTHLPPAKFQANTQHPSVIETVWKSLDASVVYMRGTSISHLVELTRNFDVLHFILFQFLIITIVDFLKSRFSKT